LRGKTYADLYAPTKGDRIPLADTDLIIVPGAPGFASLRSVRQFTQGKQRKQAG